jgi:hypothetical protein
MHTSKQASKHFVRYGHIRTGTNLLVLGVLLLLTSRDRSHKPTHNNNIRKDGVTS